MWSYCRSLLWIVWIQYLYYNFFIFINLNQFIWRPAIPWYFPLPTVSVLWARERVTTSPPPSSSSCPWSLVCAGLHFGTFGMLQNWKVIQFVSLSLFFSPFYSLDRFSLSLSPFHSSILFLSFFLSFSFLILSVFLSSAFSCSFSFFYTLLSFFFLSYLSPYLIIHFCLTIWLSISLLISYLSFIGFTISYLTTLASFCLFSSFSQGNEKSSTTFVYKKHRWRAWDSNPGPQGGRRRRIHWAIAAPSLLFVRSSLNSPVSLSVHLSASPWPNVTVLRCRDKRRRCSSVVKLLMPDSQR